MPTARCLHANPAQFVPVLFWQKKQGTKPFVRTTNQRGLFKKRNYIYSLTDSFYSYIFSLFVFQIVSHLLFIYLGAGNAWECHGACLEARGQPWESILYFHHVSTGELTQVIKLESKHLYLQNHLAGPMVQYLWKILTKKISFSNLFISFLCILPEQQICNTF